MICELASDEFSAILNVINTAAAAYKGKIPNDRYKEPYMREKELREEIQNGVKFYGLKENGVFIAVMGIQHLEDVTLIRHAYVTSNRQRQGIGEHLLHHLLHLAKTSTILVGTWEAANWAVGFYQKHGFRLVSSEEKNYLLKRYWRIPERQVETSVVLKLERQ